MVESTVVEELIPKLYCLSVESLFNVKNSLAFNFVRYILKEMENVQLLYFLSKQNSFIIKRVLYIILDTKDGRNMYQVIEMYGDWTWWFLEDWEKDIVTSQSLMTIMKP